MRCSICANCQTVSRWNAKDANDIKDHPELKSWILDLQKKLSNALPCIKDKIPTKAEWDFILSSSEPEQDWQDHLDYSDAEGVLNG